MRLYRSAHSYDLVVATASKLNVVQKIQFRAAEGTIVLRVGDSGGVTGNDHNLIHSSFGISVDAVCCYPVGSWNLFGYQHTGPDALRRIMESLIPAENKCVRFAPGTLKLDK